MYNAKKASKSVKVSFYITTYQRRRMTELVYEGKYPSVTEFIREAIRDLVIRYMDIYELITGERLSLKKLYNGES